MDRSARLAALMATTALALGAAAASAHEPRPQFAVIPHLTRNVHGNSRLAVPATWNYTYTYNGTSYTEAFIGGNPGTATTETVPVYLIPLKMEYGPKKEDATPVIPSVKASPIFTPADFTFGGQDIGTTQYEDALAKVNVWSLGGSASGYHVLLGTPTVTATQTLKVPKAQGGYEEVSFAGGFVILANMHWFNPKISALIKKLKIPANSLPIFVTTQTYLLNGTNLQQDCCIGGFHSATTAGQPYSYFTYIQHVGAFSQDVSALSHELAEWKDDPYANNNSPCGLYENGDPLENTANYGDYPYTLGGVTYHLQDIALLPYFGGPAGVTLNNLVTLQGTQLGVCANGS